MLSRLICSGSSDLHFIRVKCNTVLLAYFSCFLGVILAEIRFQNITCIGAPKCGAG